MDKESKEIIKKLGTALGLVFVVYILSAVIFYYAEKDQDEPQIDELSDAFWWAVVTLSTVGYGDIYPMTTLGRAMGIILMIFTVTVLGYVVGQINDAVVNARLRATMGLKKSKLKNHFIICGWTAIGKIAFKELIASKHSIVVIAEDVNDISTIQSQAGDAEVNVVQGDPSTDEALNNANIAECSTVIICTDDDTKNLITALTIKEKSKETRIIASVKREELKNTLKVAGVTYVASPYEMGGRLIASASFEPEVGTLIEDITTSTSGYDVQQYTIRETSPIVGMDVKRASGNIKDYSGALLVGIAKFVDGNWKMMSNPKDDVVINTNDIVIVLGDEDETGPLTEYLHADQGR